MRKKNNNYNTKNRGLIFLSPLSLFKSFGLTSEIIEHNHIIFYTYLTQHDAPEDIEYYLCGPPMMSKTVLDLLHSLGVEDEMIMFDNFGG